LHNYGEGVDMNEVMDEKILAEAQKSKEIHNELLAVGLLVSGVDSNDNIHLDGADAQGLVPLVLAAHGLSSSSAECIALKIALGETSSEWLAYIGVRKIPIKLQREERFRTETDPVRMNIDDEYTVGSAEWTTALEEWKTLKSQIRTELPYPG